MCDSINEYTQHRSFNNQPIQVVEVIEISKGRKAISVHKLFQKNDYEFFIDNDGGVPTTKTFTQIVRHKNNLDKVKDESKIPQGKYMSIKEFKSKYKKP